MSAFLERERALYRERQRQAAQKATTDIRAAGLDVTLMHSSNRALEAISDQWGKSYFDWPERVRRYRKHKAFAMAMWSGERLVGMCLMKVSNSAVTVICVEGAPDDSCQFKGKRLLVALEAATNYAQVCGMDEIRIDPINDALARLYEDVYGFTLVSPRGQAPYYAKRI